MKATLTFTLPDEEREYRRANNAAKVLSDLRGFEEWMRLRYKYDNLAQERLAELETVREKFSELVGPYLEE